MSHQPTWNLYGESHELPIPSVPHLAGFRRLGRDAWQLTSLMLAVIWVISFIIFSARFFGGWLLLARLRLGASKVSETSISILNECRQAVRLTRPTGLAIHPAVASPVAMGGLSSPGPGAPRLGRLA